MKVISKDQELSELHKLSAMVEAETRRMFQIVHQNTLTLRKKIPIQLFSSAGLTVERNSLETGEEVTLRCFCILLASEVVLNP